MRHSFAIVTALEDADLGIAGHRPQMMPAGASLYG
jgi:hypothetical protein